MRFTRRRVVAAVTTAAALSLVAAGGTTANLALTASGKAKSCKDILLVTYIQSRGDTVASIPYRIRPCGDESPGSWETAVSGPTTTAPGDTIGWVLQGLDIRLEGVGNNSKTSASAYYKGVAKLTQKTPSVPLVPLAPTSLRSITVAITFKVTHQKGGGKSNNINLPNFIKVSDTWSSHEQWANFTYKKGGYVQ